MPRLGLSGRLALIVAAALFLIQIMTVGAQYTREDGFSLTGIRTSFAREIAGLVSLFDALPEVDRPVAIDAVNAGPLHVGIETDPPNYQPNGFVLSGIAGLIAARLNVGPLHDRHVVVDYAPIDAAGPVTGGPFSRLTRHLLRITVPLRSGGYLVIDPNREVDALIFGNFLSLTAGVVGFLVAGFAVLAVFRETRPLKALAGNVERFAKSAEPTMTPETGAGELRSLIRATNQMQHEIATLLKSRALVLAGVSHDLRTQVTRLRMRIELLPPSDARNRAIGDVEAMQALVEDSLEFAGEAGSPDRGPTDLAALAHEIVDKRRADGAPNISVAGPSEGVRVSIGATALRRLIDNLVDNAIAYGGEASLTVRAGDRAELIVEDRGPGIPTDQRARIFEPFYRLEQSRNRETGGTGLGLAIVKQIVDHHDGAVTVEDRAGGGTRIRVGFPPIVTSY